MEVFIKFTEYLGSMERRNLFASHPVFGADNIEARLSGIHHSDWCNFGS